MKNILKASFDTELTPDQTLGLNNALKNAPELEAEINAATAARKKKLTIK